jgi:hypothetical protein
MHTLGAVVYTACSSVCAELPGPQSMISGIANRGIPWPASNFRQFLGLAVAPSPFKSSLVPPSNVESRVDGPLISLTLRNVKRLVFPSKTSLMFYRDCQSVYDFTILN